MVAEAPASRWNPLFIYGGVGLGKTHLLQAIGHEIHRQHPDWVITFVTCEKFVTDFIGSMMNQKRSCGHVDGGLPRALPDRPGRAAGRRHPVPVEQGQLAGRVLPHVQRASLRAQADRADLRQAAGRAARASRTGCAAASPGASSPRSRRPIWRRASRSSSARPSRRRSACPTTSRCTSRRTSRRNVRELEGALLRLAARASFQGQAISLELARDALAKLIASAPDRPHHRGASSARWPPTSTSSCTTSRGRSATAPSPTRA